MQKNEKTEVDQEKIETIYLSFFNRTVTRTTSTALKLKRERENIPSGVHYIYIGIWTYSPTPTWPDTPALYLLDCLGIHIN